MLRKAAKKAVLEQFIPVPILVEAHQFSRTLLSYSLELLAMTNVSWALLVMVRIQVVSVDP